jgi:hypothetical protein
MIELGDRQKRSLILAATAALPSRLRVAIRYRLLTRLELARARRAQMLVIGHPKSGTTWLRTLLSSLFHARHGLPPSVIMRSDELHRLEPAVPRILVTNGHYADRAIVGRRLAADGPLTDLHDRAAVLLVRHPCDIAVSWYLQFTKRQSPARRELIGHFLRRPVDHRAVSMWDFVTHPELGLPALIDYLNTWERNVTRMRRHTIVRYEDLRRAPHTALRQVLTLLDPTFSDADIERAVAFGSFENLRTLEQSGFFSRGGLALQNPDDPETFKVRRGKIGGYRDYFSAEQIAEMDALVDARLSPTLGYTTTGAGTMGRGPEAHAVGPYEAAADTPRRGVRERTASRAREDGAAKR